MQRDYSIKMANMTKPQEFTLYPYNGEKTILLQSDKRIARVNLETGKGIMNRSNKGYPSSIDLQLTPIPCELPENIRLEITKFLIENNGKDGNVGGVMSFSISKYKV